MGRNGSCWLPVAWHRGSPTWIRQRFVDSWNNISGRSRLPRWRRRRTTNLSYWCSTISGVNCANLCVLLLKNLKSLPRRFNEKSTKHSKKMTIRNLVRSYRSVSYIWMSDNSPPISNTKRAQPGEAIAYFLVPWFLKGRGKSEKIVKTLAIFRVEQILG